jgi:hypothetical protein
MVWIYFCKACEDGNHGACELGHPSPPGTYGGSLCRCPCRGNAKWNTPQWHEEELRKVLESMMDHNKAVEEMQRMKDLAKITVPPKKIELKKPE